MENSHPPSGTQTLIFIFSEVFPGLFSVRKGGFDHIYGVVNGDGDINLLRRMGPYLIYIYTRRQAQACYKV